jgi:hypothetical protein
MATPRATQNKGVGWRANRRQPAAVADVDHPPVGESEAEDDKDVIEEALDSDTEDSDSEVEVEDDPIAN